MGGWGMSLTHSSPNSFLIDDGFFQNIILIINEASMPTGAHYYRDALLHSIHINYTNIVLMLIVCSTMQAAQMVT